MAHKGKRITAAGEGIDRKKLYGLDEAVKLVKDRAKAKFDDRRDRHEPGRRSAPRRPDGPRRREPPQRHRKTVRVAVFARGDKVDQAKAAGADIVGAEDLVDIINAGKIEFDRCIATPDMMPLVGSLQIPGPRNLMPNPKVHGDPGCRRCGHCQGRRRGIPSRRRHQPCRRRQGSLPSRRCSRTSRPSPMRRSPLAGAKGTYVKRVSVSRPWVPAGTWIPRRSTKTASLRVSGRVRPSGDAGASR